MKNVKDKIIMSAAVGFTAASGITPVFAQETTNAEVIKEDVEAKKTKKEKLEDSVKTAKSNLDDVKKVTDEKKADADAAKKELEDASAAQDKQYAVVENQYDKAFGSVNEDYQTLLSKASDLEKEIASKQAELDQYTKNEESAAKNLEKAKKDLADKQAKLDEVNKELAKYDKTTIDADLKTAETEQEKAQTAYNSAKKANEDAATALTIANGDLNTKKEALNTAQKAYDDAAADVNAKQEAVNAAQANVNSFTGSDALTNAQKELDQAKSDLVNAQAAAANAETVLNKANTELSEAETAQKAAQNEYDKSVESVNDAEKALEEATKKETDAIAARDEANKNVLNNEGLIEYLTASKSQHESDVAAAKEAVKKAEQEYTNGKTEKQVAQDELDKFEKDYAQDLYYISKGTQGFFEYLGDDLGKATAKVFDKTDSYYGKIADYVKLGEENDATNLDNMVAVIPYLKKMNTIREKHGLPILQVSMFQMALAQANSDWAQKNLGHSHITKNGSAGFFGENLAWGPVDPYTGWYDEEKAYSDFIDDYKLKNPGATNEEITDAAIAAGKYSIHSGGSIGHYKALINPNYNYFGMGYSSQGKYGCNYSQDFSQNQAPTDVVMSVEDFEGTLNYYKTNADSVKRRYQEKIDAVNNASNDKSDLGVQQAKAELARLKKELQKDIDDLNTANTNKTTFEQALDKAKTDYETAHKDVVAKTEAKYKADSLKGEKEKQLNTAKENTEAKKKTKELAETNKAAADKVGEEKQSQVDQLNSEINNWNTSKAEAEKQLVDANIALNEAKGKLNGATENLTPAKKAYDDAAAAQAKAESDSKAANSAFVSADTLFQEKNDSLAKARKALANYNSVAKAVKDASEAVDAQSALIDKYTKAAEDASVAIKETTKKISLLVDSKDELDSKVEAKKKVLDVIDDVKANGSRANTSSITDEELLGYLDELAKEVDAFEELHIKFANANVKYMTLLSVYEEAKKDEAQAQTVYDEAMKALDTYIQETSKHAVKTDNNTNKKNGVSTNKNGNTSGAKKANSTNTGVETGLGLDVAMMGVTALGIVEAKRRSKKQ